MNFSIRDAKKDDMNQVLKLIQELAIFEKEENAVEVTEADLIRDGFGSKVLFKCFVAEVEGVIKGIGKCWIGMNQLLNFMKVRAQT